VLRGRLDIGQYTASDTLLFTTAITVGELAYGASRSADEAGNWPRCGHSWPA
jgi:predicted nucleic acid-binding protein